MTNLLSRYFHLGKGQRIRAQSCGFFGPKLVFSMQKPVLTM